MQERKTIKMTEGNPFYTILIFAIPMILSNLFQQFYNVIDTLIVRCFKSEESRIIRFTGGILELDCSDECNEVLQMACVGLSRIAFTYPDQVSLKNRVWYKLIEKNEKG